MGGRVLHTVPDVQALLAVRRRNLRPDGDLLAERHQGQGQVRHQYHHATDIVPTILDVAGVEMPEEYRGVKQYPVNGVSMRYSFDDAEAPTTKKRQYYAMLGTRGIWEDGWKAAALHAPLTGKGHFDQDRWELYHVDEDRAEANNVADDNPDKLKALIDAWNEEAKNNYVLPLDDRTPLELIAIERPHRAAARRAIPTTRTRRRCPRVSAANIRGRSYKIVANADLTKDAQGVLFAHGSRFGGHSLVHQGRQAALRLQLPRYQTRAGVRLRSADARQTHTWHGFQA